MHTIALNSSIPKIFCNKYGKGGDRDVYRLIYLSKSTSFLIVIYQKKNFTWIEHWPLSYTQSAGPACRPAESPSNLCGQGPSWSTAIHRLTCSRTAGFRSHHRHTPETLADNLSACWWRRPAEAVAEAVGPRPPGGIQDLENRSAVPAESNWLEPVRPGHVCRQGRTKTWRADVAVFFAIIG